MHRLIGRFHCSITFGSGSGKMWLPSAHIRIESLLALSAKALFYLQIEEEVGRLLAIMCRYSAHFLAERRGSSGEPRSAKIEEAA